MEVANAVVFLASELSRFSTGAALALDGETTRSGRPALRPPGGLSVRAMRENAAPRRKGVASFDEFRQFGRST